MVRLAWILYALSLLTGAAVLVEAIQLRRAFPRISVTQMAGVIAFVIGLFSNIMFWFIHGCRRLPQIPIAWRALLIGSLVNNASIVIFFPRYAIHLFYWLWLASFAVLTYALLMLPPDVQPVEHTAGSKQSREIFVPGEVPELLWVWLGCTIFWLGVTTINYYQFHHQPRRPAHVAVPAAAALTSHLTDYANLLQPAEQRQLEEELGAFESRTLNQIAVVIYPRSPSESIEDFTVEEAEKTRIGRKGLDNGIVLFIFVAERAARIEVGYGLEGALPDALARRILDTQLAPRFARGQYEEGVESTLTAIGDAVQGEFGNAHERDLMTFIKRLGPQLKVATIKVAKRAWPLTRDAPLEARVSLSFFGTLLGLGVWSGIVNAAHLVWSVARGTWNLLLRRPFRSGLLPVDFEPIEDTVKVAVILAVLAGGFVMVAGGGTFGGAGALVHWTNALVAH